MHWYMSLNPAIGRCVREAVQSSAVIKSEIHVSVLAMGEENVGFGLQCVHFSAYTILRTFLCIHLCVYINFSECTPLPTLISAHFTSVSTLLCTLFISLCCGHFTYLRVFISNSNSNSNAFLLRKEIYIEHKIF